MSSILYPDDGRNYERAMKPMAQAIIDDDQSGAVRVIEYEPGNGTRYVVSFVAVGQLSEHAVEAIGAYWNTPLMMVLHNIGTRTAVFVGADTQYYDLDKLECGIADRLALCVLIRYVLGLTHEAVFPSVPEEE